jgi:CheY-like chemotaxis protein
VQPFTDSILALKRFWEEPDAFDLILVDHMMPQMTGVELAAAIKEARKDIPILLYSGYISKDLQDSCLQVGVGELLRKPYRMEELADALRRLLSPGHDRHSA